MLPRTADIVIIGAGVIGASIAYHLLRENIRVVVLEKKEVAGGSSGACEGLLLMQSKKPGLHSDLALQSLQKFPTLVRALDHPIEFENKGGVVVIESEAELAAMQVFVERQAKAGLDISLLNRTQARRIEPALSEDIVGVTFSPLESLVNPLLLTIGFLQAARKAGATVLTHTRVEGIDLEHGRVAAVRTDKGRIAAPIVINAAGSWAAQIGEMVGLTIPIKPRRGQILVTEAVPPLLKRCILSAKYIAAKFDPRIAAAGDVGFAVEQTQSGNILIGSTREFAGYNKGTTFEGILTLARNISRVIPGLRNLQVIRSFAGLRPYTPDGLPILGRVDEIDGFIMAAGHEGDGITLAPITGEMIAELVSTGSAPDPLSDLSLDRFSSRI
jgi:sarcosine oxidase subunit beta